jgi:hypothetical protein
VQAVEPVDAGALGGERRLRLVETVVVPGGGRLDYRPAVPVLGGLPVVGWLFQSNSSFAVGGHRTTKSNSDLVLMVSPHIIRVHEDSDE